MTDQIEHPVDMLAELVAGALPEDDAADVEAHVLTSAECRAELLKVMPDETLEQPNIASGMDAVLHGGS